MDKAGKVIRRSSVRLKSMGSGHRDLNMVISQLRDVKSSAKVFMLAQNTASQDLLKWSMNNENEAIQDTFTQLAELNSLWTEVQKEFTGHLKEFNYQFEMILEGEHHVDHARNHMATCEQRELKMRKELKKVAKKANAGDEVRQIEIKLAQAERSKDLAQIDVVDRAQENEAVKMIRVKEGLLKLSESYLELAHKCHVIHEAHRDIVYEIPDVQDKNIHEIRYSGVGAARQAVARAKERIRRYRRHSHNLLPCAPMHEESPPPYSPTHCPENALCSPQHCAQPSLPHSESSTSNPFHLNPRSSGVYNTSVDSNTSMQQSTNPFEESGSNNRYSSLQGNETSVQWHTDYEEELAGAVGRLKP